MEKFLRRPEVESITGLSRSAIYACMERGEFPRPRRIGRHAVAWRESDIEAWVMSRKLADPDSKDSPSESRSVT